jgi:hypothetical protein
MTGEFELPQDRRIGRRPQDGRGREVPVPVLDREVHKARFEELAQLFDQGEFARRNEDGSVTRVVSYERYVDPLDKADMTALTDFRLNAAAAGIREAFSPLILPTQSAINPRHREAVAFTDQPQRALTFVQLGYEKPSPRT